MYGKLPKEITSVYGYQGCLASIDLNGESADPINNALVPSDKVSAGCEGKKKFDDLLRLSRAEEAPKPQADDG